MPLTEALGYLASLLVAVSLTMKSIWRLRMVNLVGALCFTAYGMLIRAYPVAAVNFVIVLINLYHLRAMGQAREYFRLLEVPSSSEYLAAFLKFHQDEITRFLPGFSRGGHTGELAFFVLRDMVPAGVFLAAPHGAGALLVSLDFVIPGYRDLKVAEFVYRENEDTFTQRGIHTLYTPAGEPKHEAYLKRVGFARDPGDPALYVLRLSPLATPPARDAGRKEGVA